VALDAMRLLSAKPFVPPQKTHSSQTAKRDSFGGIAWKSGAPLEVDSPTIQVPSAVLAQIPPYARLSVKKV